jgi:hypothetical protein
LAFGHGLSQAFATGTIPSFELRDQFISKPWREVAFFMFFP